MGAGRASTQLAPRRARRASPQSGRAQQEQHLLLLRRLRLLVLVLVGGKVADVGVTCRAAA